MSDRIVLTVVADSTLGGVSRSALTMARLWIGAGYASAMFLPRRLAPDRVPDPRVGLYSHFSDVPWDHVALVHLHHMNFHPPERRDVRALMDHLRKAGLRVPLMTKNVFGSLDGVLNAWPGPRATTVLGRWVAMQYTYSSYGRRHPRPFVLPNAQNTTFFRPPTRGERLQAREALGLGTTPVILRVGSPRRNKWSLSGYAALASAAEQAGLRLVLVSPPDEVRALVAKNPAVTLVDGVGDDLQLRRYYWAADAFALYAERGESFGNVLTEAILCGCPAVYRDRPLRDNSPRLFPPFAGLRIAPNDPAWIEATIALACDPAARAAAATAHSTIDAWCGPPACQALLGDLARRLTSTAPTERFVHAPGSMLSPAWAERLAVMVRHNPAAAGVKQINNSLHAP